MKIASLIPSGTDIVCALGLQEHLVGVSHACDHPATRHLPVLTRSIIDSTRPPQEIDDAVNLAVTEGQSLYQTHTALLRDLSPDLILTQAICDVCAVNERTARASLPPGAELLNLSATRVEELWGDLRAVARAAGVDGEPLIQGLQQRVQEVQTAVSHLAPVSTVTLEWTAPFFLGGHWVPELVELAGGRHLVSQSGELSRRCAPEELYQTRPEVIVLLPCGYNLQQAVQQGQELLRDTRFTEWLRDTRAQLWATDATALFSRCTPASVRACEVLAGILHPTHFASPLTHEAVRLA